MFREFPMTNLKKKKNKNEKNIEQKYVISMNQRTKQLRKKMPEQDVSGFVNKMLNIFFLDNSLLKKDN